MDEIQPKRQQKFEMKNTFLKNYGENTRHTSKTCQKGSLVVTSLTFSFIYFEKETFCKRNVKCNVSAIKLAATNSKFIIKVFQPAPNLKHLLALGQLL